jgi:hypothetical protein
MFQNVCLEWLTKYVSDCSPTSVQIMLTSCCIPTGGHHYGECENKNEILLQNGSWWSPVRNTQCRRNTTAVGRVACCDKCNLSNIMHSIRSWKRAKWSLWKRTANETFCNGFHQKSSIIVNRHLWNGFLTSCCYILNIYYVHQCCSVSKSERHLMRACVECQKLIMNLLNDILKHLYAVTLTLALI